MDITVNNLKKIIIIKLENKSYPTMWSSPMRYCSSISLASVEWPTSSKLSVASAPACSNKTSSPPGCWTQRINNNKKKNLIYFLYGRDNEDTKLYMQDFSTSFCNIILLYKFYSWCHTRQIISLLMSIGLCMWRIHLTCSDWDSDRMLTRPGP